MRVPLRPASTPEWRQWTAIYYPAAVSRRSRSIDVILYLHGHRTTIPGTRRSIWAYLKHGCWPLREHLAATGKAAVLVAPTLGPRSEAGSLNEAGGFDGYLERVLQASRSYWEGGVAPDVRYLVLSGHSGAGRLIRALAQSGDRVAARIKEVWGFDCTYGVKHDADATRWCRWARANPASRLSIFFLPRTPTAPQALKLQVLASRLGLKNMAVVASRARRRNGIGAHFWVPIEHWSELIAASPHLSR